MSGRRRSSQLTSRGRRVRIELTFHVAIFMKAVIFYRIPGCFPTPASPRTHGGHRDTRRSPAVTKVSTKAKMNTDLYCTTDVQIRPGSARILRAGRQKRSTLEACAPRHGTSAVSVRCVRCVGNTGTSHQFFCVWGNGRSNLKRPTADSAWPEDAVLGPE